jgi:beta-N-acetylhexosaminidase
VILPGNLGQSIFSKPAELPTGCPVNYGRSETECRTVAEGADVSLGAPPHVRPRAVVLGCAGEKLGADERRFFAAADPVGFILFRRNCSSRDQTRGLVEALRDSVGRVDAPVLIDQEGGRVARLRPPHWRTYPSAAQIAALPDPLAEEAARLGARLIADELARLGISVDCLPVLDLPVAGADPVIGDRAYGGDPDRVARLARAVCEGLLDGGVSPILKHIPGHGRARVDSHYACPAVITEHDELSRTDFAPFRALAAMPWAMTAHIVYRAIDPAAPATFSRTIIGEIIRGEIGFNGVLISDDLSMRALGGRLGERVQRALAAGCDLVLHCNGDRSEMEEVARAATPMTPEGAARFARGEAMRRAPGDFDRGQSERRFDALLAGAPS